MDKKDKSSKSDRLLFAIAIVVILVALVNLGIAFHRFGGLDRLTGHASFSEGSANLSIQSIVTVNFTTSIINWGNGAVNESLYAVLDSSNGTVTNGNWTANSAGLILQNDGNIDVMLNLTANKNASIFIGGTSPLFEMKTTTNSAAEGGSCVSGLANTYYTANTTSMPSCSNFTYVDATDTVRIDVRVVVPGDAPTGVKSTVITATATPL